MNDMVTMESQQEYISALESILIERSTAAARAGLQFGGDRNLYEALGYKKAPGFDDYCIRYKRQDIARRIIDQPIRATWRDVPMLVDTDDEKNESPFEQAWRELAARHRILDRFRRADTLASLGEFAVLLIGMAGQSDFSQPLIRGAAGEDGLLYLTPYGRSNITVDRHDDDKTSERFGWPVLYTLQTSIATGKTASSESIQAHHSRCVHVSGGNLESDIVGTPALEPVINLLDDMIKVVGGSAETYWMLAKAPLHANLDPKARPLSETEKTDVKDQVDEIQHKLRRVLYSSGLGLSYLSSAVADPRGPFEVIIKMISASTGIPQRMLTGSEAGELASTQDDKNFSDRIQERQTDHAEPKILRPTADMLIEAGVLPEPKDGEYVVQWGSLADADESEKASTTKIWADSMQSFGNALSIIAPSEVREKYLGLPAEHPDPPADPAEQSDDDPVVADDDDDEVNDSDNNNN